jgi:hypothetical protein
MILSKMKKMKNSNESRKKMMAKILNNQNHRRVKINHNHKRFKNYPPSFYQQNPFKNKPSTQTIHQVVLSLISFQSPSTVLPINLLNLKETIFSRTKQRNKTNLQKPIKKTLRKTLEKESKNSKKFFNNVNYLLNISSKSKLPLS